MSFARGHMPPRLEKRGPTASCARVARHDKFLANARPLTPREETIVISMNTDKHAHLVRNDDDNAAAAAAAAGDGDAGDYDGDD
eukprot:440916-Alexandrium_andersonii.AAC.1